MAIKTSEVHFRVEPDLKEEAEFIAKEMGMNLAQMLRLFMSQVKVHKGLPFPLRIYNKVTLEAMEEAKDLKKLESHDNFETFLKEEIL
jgi:DNA-damage-inducible protein J